MLGEMSYWLSVTSSVIFTRFELFLDFGTHETGRILERSTVFRPEGEIRP